ncbi:MAG: hypothetical protein GY867_00875 [bacterium]|nr:hypothetical protein [bacterium]
MQTEVVDYTNNSDSNRDKHAGRKTLHCKFVLIARSDRLHFVVGAVAEYTYHANLVEKFCDERSIASAWLQKPDVLEVVEAGVRVLGGGHLQIDEVRQRMKLFGVSKAYGVFHARDVSDLAQKDPFFTGYKVSFSKV